MTNTTKNYEAQYHQILQDCLDQGVYRDDRTGVGCYSTFNKSIKVDLSEAFPLITGRRMFPKIFKTEFDWFINGETNIKRFQDNGVTIWDAWADKNGDLGPVYGHQMRNFNNQYIDQLECVIDSLKHNPDSRRHIISLWNPAQLSKMALPPCYLYFQFFVEKNNLHMFALQRSADIFLGVPYDMALYSQILLYIAEKTGYNAKRVNVKFIDAHIYKNQQEAVEQYLDEDFNGAPTYAFHNGLLTLNNYEPGKVITAPVAV